MPNTTPSDTAAAPAANIYDHSTPAENEASNDIEAQKAVPAAVSVVAAAPVAASSQYDNDAGKGIGIAMFIVILIGLIVGWLYLLVPVFSAWVRFICFIVGIVLSSIITCGCCCANSYNLNPKVKRWALATLLCLILQWVLAIVAVIIFYVSYAATQEVTQDDEVTIVADVTFSGAYTAVVVVVQILSILAIIFAGIFTWGRNCGCNA